MTSYQFTISPRDRKIGRFIAAVRRELQKAFSEEKASRKFTQAALARRLGVNRSLVNRQLMGTENLTLKSIAEFAWALDRDLVFAMPKPREYKGANEAVLAHSQPLETMIVTSGSGMTISRPSDHTVVKTSGTRVNVRAM